MSKSPNAVGTGSGKSSILLALLRLIEIQSGALYIDGVDLSTTRRQAIRGGITALPQDPVVLPPGCSIRENLDPEGRHTADGNGNEVLTVALQKVQLWETVCERGGLDAEFIQGSFSAGQQQLLCLARCLVHLNKTQRGSKVVLLDEAMSHVDHETNKIVWATLKKEFAGSTVVEVLHRLDAIMDYDMVIVMHDGVVAEVGKPDNLMERCDSSMLRGIWDARHMEGDP
jgi:ABC-type multidrug transport system fused ATPase/permease subunit